ncbi:uncharacterized protein [Lepeophtheirus salmonis]|nr:uncharacterized protein LOC121116717 [Lepeophtheirus salmonis]
MRVFILCALIAVASATTIGEPKFNEKTMKCDFCKFVLGKINESVFSEENVDEALQQLDEICDKVEEVSGFLGETCDKFIEEVVKPKIEDLLATKPTPEEACKKFEMC